MHRIFISYKRVDKEKVFKIKDRIESAIDEKCWIDLDGIESDEQFMNVIIKAIKESEIVLFMYSKAHSEINDFENDWTVRELNFASKKGKRIVFINLDNSTLSDEFEFMYGTKQHVDGENPIEIKKLITDLSNWLKIENPKPGTTSNPSHKFQYLLSSVVLIILLTTWWCLVSGEYHLNPSLTAFTCLASILFSLSLAFIAIDKTPTWGEHSCITNGFLLASINFFSVYTMMSIGLGFANYKTMVLNLPSSILSLIAIIGLFMILYKKKSGFYLLIIVAIAFSIGSYFWLLSNLICPLVFLGLSGLSLYILYKIIDIPHNGSSLWNELE